MKFSCNRCKTRYSIADERVRGKILKIRCKSCSEIITVKEHARAETAPPPTPADAPRIAKGAQPKKAKAARSGPVGGAGLATSPAAGKSNFSAAPSTVLGVGDSKKAVAAKSVAAKSSSAVAAKSSAAAAAKSSAAVAAKSSAAVAAKSSAAVAEVDAPKNGSKPALESAFAQAMNTSPSEAAASLSAPTSLDSEWYVALDGNQSGPFDLRAARDWVAAQRLDDELYCWTDGFDDWLSIDKVAQFRDLRRPSPGGVVARAASAPSAVGMSFDEPTVIEPGGVQAVANGSTETPAVFGNAGSSGLSNADFSDLPDSAAMDLEIGEVSRVVRLPFLQAPERANSEGLPGVAAAARVGNGTGSVGSVGSVGAVGAVTGSHARIGASTGGQPVVPDVRNRKRLIPIFIAAGALVVVAGVFLFLAFGGSTDEEAALRRSRIANDDIAYDMDDPRRTKASKPGTEDPVDKTDPDTKRKGGGTSRVRKPNGGGTKSTKTTRVAVRSGGNDEVDLNGGNAEEIPEELSGDDYARVFRSKGLAINRCHAQALKKDPFLSVKKAVANVSVSPSGRVSSVKLVGISNSTLSNCLKNYIARFSFPKAKKGSNGAATLVFR